MSIPTDFFNYSIYLDDLCGKVVSIDSMRELSRRLSDVHFSTGNKRDGYRFADLCCLKDCFFEIDERGRFAYPRCWAMAQEMNKWVLEKYADAGAVDANVDDMFENLRTALREDIAGIRLIVENNEAQMRTVVSAAGLRMGLGRLNALDCDASIAKKIAGVLAACEQERDDVLQRIENIKIVKDNLAETFAARDMIRDFDAKRDMIEAAAQCFDLDGSAVVIERKRKADI